MVKPFFQPIKVTPSERECVEDFALWFNGVFGDKCKPYIVSVSKEPCWIIDYYMVKENPKIELKPVDKVR